MKMGERIFDRAKGEYTLTYDLTSGDIHIINSACRSLGGYIDLSRRTFNAKIGPKEKKMKIRYYDQRKRFEGEPHEIILEPAQPSLGGEE